MKVLLTGATGFIGKKLFIELFKQGHEIVVLARRPEIAKQALGLPCRAYAWDLEKGVFAKAPMFEGIEAVIHLAGDTIAEKWTEEKKAKILSSRVEGTRDLLKAISNMQGKQPSIFITASAIGFYEQDTFLASVVRQWEEALFRHAPTSIRTCAVRIGLVLGRDGGVLTKMLPIFKAGLGGRLGDGNQWMSWIHIDDVVGVFMRALSDEAFRGPVDAVAREPVTNLEFTRQLAHALRRPAFFPVPAAALKLTLGEMSALALVGVQVIPKGPMEGHRYQFPVLEAALADLCSEDSEWLAHQWIDLPIQEVFEFFSQANNLEKITPPWLKFKILSQTTPFLKSGTVISYRLKIHGVPVRWQSRIESWEPPNFFSDIQLKGPYSKWDHEHHFFPVTQGAVKGTLISDRVRYRLPGGAVGQWLAGSWVRGDVEQIFRYRRETTEKLLRSPGVHASRQSQT